MKAPGLNRSRAPGPLSLPMLPVRVYNLLNAVLDRMGSAGKSLLLDLSVYPADHFLADRYAHPNLITHSYHWVKMNSERFINYAHYYYFVIHMHTSA